MYLRPIRSTGVSPRPMLMGAPRNALRAFNAGVSLAERRSWPSVMPHTDANWLNHSPKSSFPCGSWRAICWALLRSGSLSGCLCSAKRIVKVHISSLSQPYAIYSDLCHRIVLQCSTHIRRLLPENLDFCNFYERNKPTEKPQGSSGKEPPCGFHFIYTLLTALYRPVSYLLRFSRYRNVAIWPRVQVELGSNRSPPTPAVMPFSTAQATACA